VEEKNNKDSDKIEDFCPLCGTNVLDFTYYNVPLLKIFGLVECTTCGIVFSPASMRNLKLSQRDHNSMITSGIVSQGISA